MGLANRMLSVRRRAHEAAHRMTPFIGNTRNRQTHGDKRQTGDRRVTLSAGPGGRRVVSRHNGANGASQGLGHPPNNAGDNEDGPRGCRSRIPGTDTERCVLPPRRPREAGTTILTAFAGKEAQRGWIAGAGLARPHTRNGSTGRPPGGLAFQGRRPLPRSSVTDRRHEGGRGGEVPPPSFLPQRVGADWIPATRHPGAVRGASGPSPQLCGLTGRTRHHTPRPAGPLSFRPGASVKRRRG